jgi:hypothetical protein
MTAQREDKKAKSDERTAVYIYGILPGDVEVESGTAGVGDPPGEIRVVKHRDLAALVSDVNLDRPLGRADDLVAHEELLDSTAAAVPVLPLRFGAVVTDDDAVADELLEQHYDEFSDALSQLEGHAEFVVKGRYVEHAMLSEILADDPEAAELRDEIKDADPDLTRDQRIALGEIINNAIEEKREADALTLDKALSKHASAGVPRPPSHELDAVSAAYLVKTDKADELRKAVGKLSDEWRGRIELRLLGPMAAYDFVGTAAQADAATGS